MNHVGKIDIKNIDNVTLKLNTAIRKYVEGKFYNIGRVEDDIKKVLCTWTGSTWVGVRKDNELEQSFQKFFESLYDFLSKYDNILMRDSGKSHLYSGKLYRYLGYGCPVNHGDNKGTKIKPEYNNIWVSWSKKEGNAYLLQKLYEPITELVCQTGDIKGIDLESFGVSKGDEKEVVYPTIEDCIVEVKSVLF